MAAAASSAPTDAATLERQTVDLLYKCPYVRQCGAASEFVDVELPREAAAAAAGSRARAIVRPPPSAVTTLSYNELRRTFTRPQRYGPAEVGVRAGCCGSGWRCGRWRAASRRG